MLNKNFSAQGTIEYLVIIAVVVVISLVVVGLFVNLSSSPSQQITTSSDKAGSIAVGGISIVEAVSDLDGDTLISLMNNSSEGITLKKITVGGNENNYDNYISGVDSVPVSLSGLASSCPCESGQKSVKCEFVFEYDTLSGLRKIERRTINVQCTNSTNNPTPTNPNKLVEPIVLEMGSGTLEDPWIIRTCLELQDMNQNLDGNYILGNDIDCAEVNTFQPIAGSCTVSWGNCVPNEYFLGSLNGNNKKITNLTINSDYPYFGLFGNTMQGGLVKDLNIENITVNCWFIIGFSGCGTIAGVMEDGNISNVHVQGTINAEDGVKVGGLVGSIGQNADIYSNIEYSSFSGDIIASSEYGAGAGGGLTGIAGYVNIDNCFTQGTISGSFLEGVGQFYGICYNCNLTNSTSTMNIPS